MRSKRVFSYFLRPSSLTSISQPPPTHPHPHNHISEGQVLHTYCAHVCVCVRTRLDAPIPLQRIRWLPSTSSMNEIPSSGEVFRAEDGTVSTVLPSNYGQDYEASEGELEEYAEYIGIDPAKEPELMWIAKEGLRAPLPEDWRACQTDDNEVYYFNFQTGESLWDHPMDEHFKAQVINERAKRGGGGGGRSVGATVGDAPRTGRTTAGTGSTKTIAESFFLKPTAALPSNRTPGSLAEIGGAGVAASPTGITTAKGIQSPGVSMKDGASASRALPGMSDILGLSSTSSPPLSCGASRSTATTGLSRTKEKEAALRKRLEEGNKAQLRTLRIELDKKVDAERQRLAEARTKLQKELDTAWEERRSSAAGGTVPASSAASVATQCHLQIDQEVKEIEESWKARLHDVGARVRELQQKVEEKQQTLLQTFQQSPEELRKTLEERNAAEVAQLREAKKKESDAALAQLKSEQASALTEAQLHANNTVAAAAKATEAEFEKKLEERRVQNEAMLASLKAMVESKQADLASKEKATAAASSTATAPNASAAAAAAGVPSDVEEATIAAAQAAADAEVAKAREASAAVVERLRVEYAAKKSEKEASLKAAQQKTSPLSRSSITPSAMSSPTGGLSSTGDGFSAAEQKKLDEENQKLRDEADRAARIFEEETKIMVENKRAGRPLTAAPSADVAASVSAEAIAALGRTANQEQRAREAENTRHFMVMKQLEAKHDQAVRTLKAHFDKNLASSISSSAPNVFNPRQQPSFATQLAARKREWLRDHPAPSAEMPTLPPIPELPAATLQSDAAAVRMPDEEEQAKLIKMRLAQVREEAQQQYDKEAQALQTARQEELETWRETYRSSRLVEVEKAMSALREAAAEADALAGEGQRLEKLQSELQALSASILDSDKEHEHQTGALAERIADLEASLAQLRIRERHEEEALAEQLRSQQQALLLKDANKHSPSAHAADISASAFPSSTAAPASSELHISEEEAASEAAALRARWTALLEELRAAVQREMETYQRALDESTAQNNTTSASGAVGAHPADSAVALVTANAGAQVHTVSTPRDRGPVTCAISSLPPPAPSAILSGSTLPGQLGALQEQKPPQPTPSSLAVGSTATNSSGYSNSLQRHSRESDNSGAGSMIMGSAATRVTASSSVPQLRIMGAYLGETGAHTALPVQRPRHSSLPQSHSPEQPHQLWNDAGAMPSSEAPLGGRGEHQDVCRNASVSCAAAPWVTVPGGTQGGGPTACTSAASAQQAMETPDGRFGYSGGPTTGGVSVDVDVVRARHHAARLASLQQTVRARRRALQARRHEMEALRDEWRADMRSCKQQGDRAMACQLLEVKAELEVRARDLNEEVLQLKQMHEGVREEVRQFRRWVDLHQQPEGQLMRGSGGNDSSSAAGRDSGFTANKPMYMCRGEGDWSLASSSKTNDVMGLLHSMVDRTERLEELLLLSRLETHSPSAHQSGMQHSAR
ncbi:hypothetical protein, conserved [Leishmania tarentolae]|uniref:WW domain-containing protein n=1 Tax=Leishmania tarentolae TaxID=5689 RepID=A0A640KDL7_LEITA|nr:hypothetical protein, conserved [Leishmania tarentolae]